MIKLVYLCSLEFSLIDKFSVLYRFEVLSNVRLYVRIIESLNFTMCSVGSI